ncbi:riboflavin synthase, alpha subunit [Sphaeroforma arctica JP610]|uniref:Riboflavin synthase, alpha subunit n=1 Tax=Sphaeroforma arctica JP610 TaxID=667725 RepID=A0A0L0GBL0_9EUKA|nr:riboflavin synthase, alpha subunit [Sphaeroforma arctica JP610]KNC85623.1 riboflavin synthase, alpha subunit [Sphaeroforma arctica JP610]|eukprot:XP_014159525.1 riboflavin synthase, alpha subunit [Sphaeroforma arctica JP610]
MVFTGIVQGLCPVASFTDKEGIKRLVMNLGAKGEALSRNLQTGASISLNGACMTVVKFEADSSGNMEVSFDIMQESLNKTNLGALAVGDKVNVERALKIGDELGGHQVSGHVDVKARVDKVITTPNNKSIYFAFEQREGEEDWTKYIVDKGYITVDGASLTVVKVGKACFSVCLIPETLARTTLGFREEGDFVNIEVDNGTKVIVNTIERLLPKMLGDYTNGGAPVNGQQ